MAKLNIYDIDQLKNVNEKRVWDILSYYVENTTDNSVCLCGICVVDIVAITLNSIPPHYQVDENYDAARKLVPDIEVLNAIKKAIGQVKLVPHH